ncbi:Acetylornithine aminotransferase [Fructobacillus sp. EFB-N1]|uniref:acetylornithine transaminase n=1 Tax=Fructobacillus sp. EFB-N1 TaxID=1658766 RepID=UPI00064DF9CD|nr:acetylornithine transaminase [Fructobacillus sp. EFB-N1]KMK52718.1 Acetylornithine aminotransferase [Fructobacillus sp. EFB-N1]
MTTTMHTYDQFPFDIVDGHDAYLIDDQGKEYLDLTAGIGVCNFGYSNQQIKQAVAKQVEKVWHITNLYQNQLAEEVAEDLCPASYQAFFCNSGTEANEAAIKLAHKATGKHELVAFDYGFHGRTTGSLSVTGYPHIQEGFAPLMPAVKMVPFNDPAALDAITEDTAAVILEVIQGEGGINVGQADWLHQVQDKCHATGTLLIIDEVQSGMGRTGHRFAFEHYGLEPDMITVAKGLANGLPVGALLAKESVAKHFQPGDHGTTFGGNKVVMSAAKEVLKQLNPEFLATVQAKGDWLFDQLEQKLSPLEVVTGISGGGLMVGIHLADSLPVGQVIQALQKEGILTLSARGNTLRLLPPLIVDQDDLAQAIDQISQIIQQLSNADQAAAVK